MINLSIERNLAESTQIPLYFMGFFVQNEIPTVQNGAVGLIRKIPHKST
jgi:hypothetical protein